MNFFCQVPPPVVTWNIAPSMGHSYKCREAELVPIPRYCLRMVEKVGTCHAGEVIVNELFSFTYFLPLFLFELKNCNKPICVVSENYNPFTSIILDLPIIIWPMLRHWFYQPIHLPQSNTWQAEQVERFPGFWISHDTVNVVC